MHPNVRPKLSAPHLAFFALMALLAALPATALAQGISAPFELAPDDYFVNVILKGILGDVINASGTSADTTITGSGTLGEVFRAFNRGIAYFAVIVVAFITVVGVLQSGNDGEFLGRRWSSMWVPVRFAMGSVLVLPLTNSGYAFCQAMVLWVAVQGVSFADSVWNAVVDQVIVRTNASRMGLTVTAGLNVQSIIRQVAYGEVCSAAMNSKRAQDAMPYQMSRLSPTYDGQQHTTTIAWGLDGGAECGSLKFSYEMSMGGANGPTVAIRQTVNNAQIAAVQELHNRYRELARSYVATVTTDTASEATTRQALDTIGARIEADITDYTTRLNSAAQAAIAASPYAQAQIAGVEQMKRYGFVMAGMWHMELAKYANAAREGLKSPEVVQAQVLDQSDADQTAMYYVSLFDAAINRRFGARATAGASAGSTEGAVSTRVVDFNVSMSDFAEPGFFTGVLSSVAGKIVQFTFGVGPGGAAMSNGSGGNVYSSTPWSSSEWIHGTGSNTSVLLQLKDKGDLILNAANVLFGIDIAAKFWDGARTSGPVGQVIGAVAAPLSMPANIVKNLSAYVVTVAGALFVLGIALSILIPMMPYIIWVGGILSLVILILEALVAIMVWAVMLMHPSGDGLTSDYNRQGIMILLAVFARGPLMVLGMAIGLYLVEPMVLFVNDTFRHVIVSVQASTFTGVISIVVLISIYVSLVLLIVDKSFSFSYVLPDRVLRWIGGDGTLTGEEREAQHRGENMVRTAGMATQNLMMTKMMGRR